MSAARMLAEFHAALGQTFGDGGSSNKLRATLHREETRELCDELATGNRVGIAHELADVVYIAFGTAYSLGIDLDAVLAEVHRANMSKRGPDGTFTVREDGKVLKGEHYQPPDVAGVLGIDAPSAVAPGDLIEWRQAGVGWHSGVVLDAARPAGRIPIELDEDSIRLAVPIETLRRLST